MGPAEEEAQPLDLEIGFHDADSVLLSGVRLITMSREDARWTSCRLQLEVAGSAWEASMRDQFFGDTPENRLGGEDIEFDRALPLHIEIGLRPEYLSLLPAPDAAGMSGVIAALSQSRAAENPLFDQDAWRALQVWQEHALDPSIGGGVLKLGYRTTWSPIRDTVDMLKRRGPVSRTMVEAFIEHGLPVHFEPDADALTVILRAGERAYSCLVSANDAASALDVRVALGAAVPKEAESAVTAAVARINEDLLLGDFTLDGGTVRYHARLEVEGPLLNEELVIQSLRAAVSLVHGYAPDLLSLISS
jgi:hypothetical protein